MTPLVSKTTALEQSNAVKRSNLYFYFYIYMDSTAVKWCQLTILDRGRIQFQVLLQTKKNSSAASNLIKNASHLSPQNGRQIV